MLHVRTRERIVALGLVVLAVVLLRTAWAADDAFTTFRVVDNALAGHGLRWNVAERVQVYTHPLWLLALLPISALVGPYAGALALGSALSLGVAGWLAARGAPRHAVLVFTALLASSAFVDYATSGLENPLAHALLVAFAARLATLPERPSLREGVTLVGLAALVMVDRLDHAVLVAPALAVVARRVGLRAALIGSLPLVAWEAFALVYYGFPFPNTAYAKLGTRVPALDSVWQGLGYLENAVWWDPVTAAVIVLGPCVALRGRTADRALAAGVVAWLVYVVRVGGDHMAGRFLTPAFVLALLLLVRAAPARVPTALAVAALAVLGAFARHPPTTTGADLFAFDVDEHGVAAERAVLYRVSGLLRQGDHPIATQAGAAEGVAARALGPHTVERGMIGWFGYFAGPDVHVVDPFALGDPLLAHLPPRAGPHRVGHWWRDVPEGYLDAAAAGGTLPDPDLQSYWEDVQLVTRGPLSSPARWAAVARLNRPHDPRVAAWCARGCSTFPSTWVRGGRAYELPDEGLAVTFPSRTVKWIDVRADPGRYELRVFRSGQLVAERELFLGADAKRTIGVPDLDADAIRIVPEPGARAYVRRLAAGPKPETVALQP